MKQDTNKEEVLNIKRKMMEEAKFYASVSDGGVTINNPKKYKAFRDGQDSGYMFSEQELNEFKKENDQLKKKISESIIGLETIRGLLFHGNGEGKFKNMIDYLDRIISKSQNIKP